MSLLRLRTELESLARARGVALFGIAEISKIKTDDLLLPKEIISRLPYAISLALPLSKPVLDLLTDHPDLLYEHHYRQLNFALDRIALDITLYLQNNGYAALPIPASQVIDWENQRGHLSHKRIAIGAGLGWLGRNNLLVTPEYGAQVRLVTILTDLELEPGTPLNQDCGQCRRCLDVCPANAIREKPEEFDHYACFEKLKEFQRQRYVHQFICGLCVRACSGNRT
jgi:epoxyqueuosine reductase|uniref:Epoxyqueuosine reductase n=1 Tax=candidate division WOR-3 bacterium TaxID=2052148 RepID=A0A7V3PTN9_UNCW3